MGRTVQNEYKNTVDPSISSLSVVSNGYYSINILFNTNFDGISIIDMLRKYKWCYEQTKGQVYTMDLSLSLPKRMGYGTPRAYLRDYILYCLGHDCHKVDWRRPSIHDYIVRPCDLYPRVKTY